MAEILKPLIVALVVYLVFKVLKAYAVGAALRARGGDPTRRAAGPPPGGIGAKPGWDGQPGPQQAAQPVGRVEDLVACRVCGTYIASRGATGCGRQDCPQGRR